MGLQTVMQDNTCLAVAKIHAAAAHRDMASTLASTSRALAAPTVSRAENRFAPVQSPESPPSMAAATAAPKTGIHWLTQASLKASAHTVGDAAKGSVLVQAELMRAEGKIQRGRVRGEV